MDADSRVRKARRPDKRHYAGSDSKEISHSTTPNQHSRGIFSLDRSDVSSSIVTSNILEAHFAQQESAIFRSIASRTYTYHKEVEIVTRDRLQP